MTTNDIEILALAYKASQAWREYAAMRAIVDRAEEYMNSIPLLNNPKDNFDEYEAAYNILCDFRVTLDCYASVRDNAFLNWRHKLPEMNSFIAYNRCNTMARQYETLLQNSYLQFIKSV